MDRDTVIRWALEAGLSGLGNRNLIALEHFSALAYAAGAEEERETLCQITPEMIEAGCEALYGYTRADAIEWAKEDKFDGYAYEAQETFRKMIDAAIRARGNGGENV